MVIACLFRELHHGDCAFVTIMTCSVVAKASRLGSRPAVVPATTQCVPRTHRTVCAAAGSESNTAGESRRGLLLQAGLLTCMAWQGPAMAKPPTIVEVDKAKPGERDVLTTSTGLKLAEVSKGTGTASKTGDLVLVEVVGSLEGGQVFIDTRKMGAPLAFQIGTTNKYVPEGLSQAVEGMVSGSVRLAVLPPSLGYGEKSVALPGGTVPPNSKLFYEVELLRCETVSMGLACCTEKVFTGNDGACLKMQKPPQQQ